MTPEEKAAALRLTAEHALGAAQVKVNDTNIASVVRFLDVDADGTVKVFGGKVESNHAAYVVVPTPWAPRVHWDIMGGGKDLPVTFAKLIEDLRLANEL